MAAKLGELGGTQSVPPGPRQALHRSAFTVLLRRRSRLRHSSERRGLVDRVAGKLVELVREQVSRKRRIARRERRRPAVELDADQLVRGLVLERDRPTQPRAKPAGEQLG